MNLPIPFPANTISLPYGAVDGKYYTFASPHQGTDFSSVSKGVTTGTVIRASGPGVVVRAGVGPAGVTPTMTRPNSLAGNSIDVDYGDVITRYMHRPYGSPSPKAGDRVVEGTVLGVIGNTGLSGGAHLHMETWDKATGRRVNPANYFDFTRVVVAATGAAVDAKPFNPAPSTHHLEDDMPNPIAYVKGDKTADVYAVYLATSDTNNPTQGAAYCARRYVLPGELTIVQSTGVKVLTIPQGELDVLPKVAGSK